MATNIKCSFFSYFYLSFNSIKITVFRNTYRFIKRYIFRTFKITIPIYIDKPLAAKTANAEKLLGMKLYPSQIFTGSALAFDPQISDVREKLNSLGEIKFIFGSAPGAWDKYSIHLIDPLLALFNSDIEAKLMHRFSFNDFVSVKFQLEKNILCNLRNTT